MTQHLRYYGTYACVVQSQAADDTVDVLPDDDLIRGAGLSAVPILHGVPGCRVRVAAGARCLLGFRGGSPTEPYVSLWEAGSVISLHFGGGSLAAARVGDPCSVSLPILSAIGTLNGSPFAASLAIATQIYGVIGSGAQKVFAG